MDPYLETQGLWESFHPALVTHCAAALNQRLPDGYVAKIETRVALVSLDLPVVQRIPDVLEGHEPDSPVAPSPEPSLSSSSAKDLSVATIEPVTIPLARGEVQIRQRWIEISSLPELELITVIEILFPSNKSGSGRAEYLEKRDALIDQPVNLVEIDLLLGGRPMPMRKTLAAGHFHAIVARASDRPNSQVYAWTIRHALPPVPIPLRAPDADVTLELAEAFNLTYERGRFKRVLRHGSPLPDHLPLSSADRQWAEGLVC
jgi:hypothetical protein